MSPPRRILIKFVSWSFIVLGLVFFLHGTIRDSLQLERFGDELLLSYCLNLFLAVLIVLGIYLVRDRLSRQLGFLFIGGSFLKFAAFFMLLYPSYTEDQQLSRPEFFAFFIPYILSLILETYYTSKLLRHMEKKELARNGQSPPENKA